jgi:8-oxo-dGTP pyrophosphatase MutT (NUDIX family)
VARLTGTSRSRLRNARATSAGGIVVRLADGRHELVLGLRRLDRERETWTLPKGTPKQGETTEETALREVAEETGLQVRIVEPVGEIDYFFIQDHVRIHKTVHYFLMLPTGGDMAAHDHEFDDVAWVAVDEADAFMRHETERQIVARARPAIARTWPLEAPPA